MHVHVNSHVAAYAPRVLTGVEVCACRSMAKTNWAVTRVTAIKVGGCTYEEALPAVKWAGLLWLVHWGPGHEPTWEPWECLALTLQDVWQPNTLWCAFEHRRIGVVPTNPELDH